MSGIGIIKRERFALNVRGVLGCDGKLPLCIILRVVPVRWRDEHLSGQRPRMRCPLGDVGLNVSMRDASIQG